MAADGDAHDHDETSAVAAIHSVGVIDMSGEVNDVKLCMTALDRVLRRPGSMANHDDNDDTILSDDTPVNNYATIPQPSRAPIFKYGGRKRSTKTLTSVGQTKPTTKSGQITTCMIHHSTATTNSTVYI